MRNDMESPGMRHSMYDANIEWVEHPVVGNYDQNDYA